MLQGNPLEAKYEVQDRTSGVRQLMGQQHATVVSGREKAQSWREMGASAFDLRVLLERHHEFVRYARWLPAGIAIGIVLSALL